MDYTKDQNIIMLLDAGGTNFVFSAMQKGETITTPVHLPANGHDLDLCLETLYKGFSSIMAQLPSPPSAISFAFPGPADYPGGIIGDLQNLAGFRGGVPLKALLEDKFQIPVFINNDGDLFAYGEAIGGILPEINKAFEESGNKKRYQNLIGITLGTGFGAGIVRNNELFIGDNSIAGEVWITATRYNPRAFAEEGVSTRAIQQVYNEAEPGHQYMPKDIFEIATGKKTGDKDKAAESFAVFGKNLGDSLANLISLLDGIVVMGGGLAQAASLFKPAMFDELNSVFKTPAGDVPRLVQKVYDFDDPLSRQDFLKDNGKEISVGNTGKKTWYDPEPKTTIATSKLGASRAISLGAYAFALKMLM